MPSYFMRPDAVCNFADGPVGTDFENVFCNEVADAYSWCKKSPIKKYHGIREIDYYQGTDATFDDGELRIRIDPTLNFYGKPFMPYIADSEIPCGNGTVLFGIRHGNEHNGYTPFPEPVVVIGISADAREYNNNFFCIKEDLQKNMNDIMSFAYDIMYDYKAMTIDGRLELESTPLRKNPYYRPPQKRAEKYGAVEDWRDKHLDRNGQLKDDYLP